MVCICVTVMRDDFNWISFLQNCGLFGGNWSKMVGIVISARKGGVKGLCSIMLLTAQIPMGTLSYFVLKLLVVAFKGSA